MSTTKAAQSLQALKSRLDKIVSSEDELSHEIVQDIVNAIKDHSPSADMITKLDLGPSMRRASNKLPEGSTLRNEIIALLKTWRDMIMASKASAASAKEGKRSTEAPRARAPETAAFVLRIPTSGEGSVQASKAELTGERRAIFVGFTGAFSLSTPQETAEKISILVEKSLFTAHTGRAYASKARLIISSLKTNPVLRSEVLAGNVLPDTLVRMSPAELASQEAKEAREKILQEDAEARQLNWLEEHRTEIQKSLGIDPANNWDYDDGEDGLSEPDVEAPDM